MPSPASTVGPKLPLLVPATIENVTVAPPVVTAFPFASFTARVTVACEPALKLAMEIETKESFTEAAPGTTVIVGSALVTAVPPAETVTVDGVPARTPVKVALYVPSRLSLTAPKLPSLVPPATPITTESPPPVRRLPAASRAVRVTVVWPPEATVSAEIATVDSEGEKLPGTTVSSGWAPVTSPSGVEAMTVVAAPATSPVKVAW